MYVPRLANTLEKYAIPFAAGTMITVALVGLMPEAYHLIGDMSLWILLGAFFVVFLFENVLFDLHHHSDDGHHHHSVHQSSVPMVIIGDTIHNFIDGVAIGASYLVSPSLGLVTAMSTFLHEIPHEIGDFGILYKSGMARNRILVINILSAATSVLGAFSVLLFADNTNLIGGLMAVAAGIFFYLGAIDFLPRATSGFSSKAAPISAIILGVVAMMLTLRMIPHSHDHEHESTLHQDERYDVHLDESDHKSSDSEYDVGHDSPNMVLEHTDDDGHGH